MEAGPPVAAACAAGLLASEYKAAQDRTLCRADIPCPCGVCPPRSAHILHYHKTGGIAMSRLSKAALITFVVATLAGSCLHFLYALWPNGLTALLAPVNESLWEHVKILYWPCLLSGVLLVRREPESLGARAFSLLLSAAVMLGVGYLYHVVLEGDSLFFDVALYVLVMAAFFLLPCFLRTPVWSRTRLLWVVLVLALGAATFVFTWCPPDGLLFRDLSLPAFYSLPC